MVNSDIALCCCTRTVDDAPQTVAPFPSTRPPASPFQGSEVTKSKAEEDEASTGKACYVSSLFFRQNRHYCYTRGLIFKPLCSQPIRWFSRQFVMLGMPRFSSSRTRGGFGDTGRQELAGVASGVFVHPAGRRPQFCFTRLFSAVLLQPPQSRQDAER